MLYYSFISFVFAQELSVLISIIMALTSIVAVIISIRQFRKNSNKEMIVAQLAPIYTQLHTKADKIETEEKINKIKNDIEKNKNREDRILTLISSKANSEETEIKVLTLANKIEQNELVTAERIRGLSKNIESSFGFIKSSLSQIQGDITLLKQKHG